MEQKWPSHLVIVRHGESERNVAKDIAKSKGAHTYGSGLRDMDTPLTKEGIRQARSTGEHLAKEYDFDAIFTSPYQRTVQTAEKILEQMHAKPPLKGEERIREIEFGILDGLTSDGMKNEVPGGICAAEPGRQILVSTSRRREPPGCGIACSQLSRRVDPRLSREKCVGRLPQCRCVSFPQTPQNAGAKKNT